MVDRRGYRINKEIIDTKKGKNKTEVADKMENKIDKVRQSTDEMVSKIDEQAIRNFELNLELNNLRSELEHNLNRLGEHTYCPSKVKTQCDEKEVTCESGCGDKCPSSRQPVEEVKREVVHGDDCHCSKCCPNPNPNFFQRNKTALLMGVLWIAIVILAVGWSPTGGVFDDIQNSWVDLIVNFFKMGIFAVAGIATYKLTKKKDE